MEPIISVHFSSGIFAFINDDEIQPITERAKGRKHHLFEYLIRQSQILREKNLIFRRIQGDVPIQIATIKSNASNDFDYSLTIPSIPISQSPLFAVLLASPQYNDGDCLRK